MAGNKFRNYRNGKDYKVEKEENHNIERNRNIVLKKDYNILLRAKEEKKYYSDTIYKEGKVTKVVDIIKNDNITYIKIELNKNSKLIFGYIPLKDKKGNFNVQTFESNEKKFEEIKPIKYKLETYGSIKLGEANITNNENNKKNKEYANDYKKNNELLDKMINFFKEKNIEEARERTDENNISKAQKINTDLKNKNPQLNNEDQTKKDLNGEKKISKTNKISANNFINQFHYISNNYYKKNDISQDSLTAQKKYLSYCYLMLKKLEKSQELNNIKDKIELPNLLLEPKYKKGVQVIYRPIGILKPLCNIIYKKFNIGHILIRYYDKEKGIDKIIESGSSGKYTSINNILYNIIEFEDFKKEDFEQFKYNVLQDEELSEDISYESVKDVLMKRYNKDGICIRGKYTINNCCFHTAMEVMILFGKSEEIIKKLFEEKIYQRYEKIIELFNGSLIIL